MDELELTQRDCSQTITDFEKCPGEVGTTVSERDTDCGIPDRPTLRRNTSTASIVQVSEAGAGDRIDSSSVRPLITFPSDIPKESEMEGSGMVIEDGTNASNFNAHCVDLDTLLDVCQTLRVSCELLQNAQNTTERELGRIKKDFNGFTESNERALKQVVMSMAKAEETSKKTKEKKLLERKKEMLQKEKLRLKKENRMMKLEEEVGMLKKDSMEIIKYVEKLRHFTEKFTKKEVPNLVRLTSSKTRSKK